MGLKKYEIITVGSDRRVRALRSWAVGGRYVNIGDVGGIVYDEKTLSQDGACWLFRGNFGFPGARIGGDSVVDVDEATLSAAGAPNVDILGSSVVVGSKLRFLTERTAMDAVVLGADDFEQGTISYKEGANWETLKAVSAQSVRLKSPIFAGGKPWLLKCGVPGYSVQAYALDRDGLCIAVTNLVQTGAGVTISVPAGQYFYIRLLKNPVADIVPADATTAAITFEGSYDTKLSIIDSRVEINPANATGVTIIYPGGAYTITSGAKYPEAIIRNSKVSINSPGAASRSFRLLGQIIGSTATLDATASDVTVAGQYSNIKNLTASGALASGTGISAYNIIQATDCDNFAVSPTIFPGLAAAQTANVPFIFQGCNVPNGLFYHHVQIANTYKNIDFAKASVDLGKPTASGQILASSEVEGMYRVYSLSGSVFGALVESYDSVKSLNVSSNLANSYGTTIYKDAYFSGLFGFAGTNVFGNKVRSHPLAQVLNVQPRAVQGTFNTLTVGETITGVVAIANRVGIPRRFRLNRSESIFINGVPSGVETQILAVDLNDKIVGVSSWAAGDRAIAPYSIHPYAFIQFRKTGDAPITPEDLAGVTVTVYNGCKIVNTGAIAVNMRGNIRVEDNATLINADITGTGYFGGNAVASSLFTTGSVFMKDNAKFTKTGGTNAIRNLRITENGTVNLGDVTSLGVVQVADNANLSPTAITLTECDIFMSGNASITSSVSIAGVLRMKDNAKVSAGALTVFGDITLCGSYNQTAARSSWTGKRVIYSEAESEYDNNVKTKYDF